MKRFILGIALVACAPVFAQDQTGLPHSFQVFHANGGYRVVAEDGRSITASAMTIEVARDIENAVRLRGFVQIALGRVEISADEVIYHWQTGELEPSGNVRVRRIE